jgi:hypothetical protein
LHEKFPANPLIYLERETRLELATPTLARLCSTTELFPLYEASLYEAPVTCQAADCGFLTAPPDPEGAAPTSWARPRAGRETWTIG